MPSRRPIVGLLTVACLAATSLSGGAASGEATTKTIWTVDPTPVPPDNVPAQSDNLTFDATAAVSPTDAWAVGGELHFRQRLYHFRPLAEHWDGTSWSVVPTPVLQPLANTDQFAFSDVAAVSHNDVWAIANQSDENDTSKAIISEHWDGTRWTVVPFPTLGASTTPAAGSITAISASDVWVAGSYDLAVNQPCTTQLFEHWDGARWTTIPGPDVTGPANCQLYPRTIAGSSPTDIWVVGEDESNPSEGGEAFTEHYDGKRWSRVALPFPSPYGSRLSDLNVLSPTNAWAVGDFYNAPDTRDDRTLIDRWNGKAWSVVPSPNVNILPSGAADSLLAVTALSADDLWTVGSAGRSDGLPDPLTEHWDGTSWTVVASPNPDGMSNLGDVSSAASGNVFAIGAYSSSPRGTVRTPAVLHTTEG